MDEATSNPTSDPDPPASQPSTATQKVYKPSRRADNGNSLWERRARVIQLRAQGVPIRAIAEELGVSHETAARDERAWNTRESQRTDYAAVRTGVAERYLVQYSMVMAAAANYEKEDCDLSDAQCQADPALHLRRRVARRRRAHFQLAAARQADLCLRGILAARGGFTAEQARWGAQHGDLGPGVVVSGGNGRSRGSGGLDDELAALVERLTPEEQLAVGEGIAGIRAIFDRARTRQPGLPGPARATS
jgi:hypothetical protein